MDDGVKGGGSGDGVRWGGGGVNAHDLLGALWIRPQAQGVNVIPEVGSGRQPTLLTVVVDHRFFVYQFCGRILDEDQALDGG